MGRRPGLVFLLIVLTVSAALGVAWATSEAGATAIRFSGDHP